MVFMLMQPLIKDGVGLVQCWIIFELCVRIKQTLSIGKGWSQDVPVA